MAELCNSFAPHLTTGPCLPVRCMLQEGHDGDHSDGMHGWPREMPLSVLHLAQPDYRKKLEELAEWCDAEEYAAIKKWGSHENPEYNGAYSHAMAAVAQRIRGVLNKL